MSKLTESQFRDLVAAIESGAEARASGYTQRAGATPCLSIYLSSPGRLWMLALDAAAYLDDLDDDDAPDLDEIGSPAVDSLGRGVVAYWPSVPWQDVEPTYAQHERRHERTTAGV